MKQKHQDIGSYSNDVRPRQRVSQKSYRFIKKSKNSARASTSLLSLLAQLRYVLWRELELTPQDLKKTPIRFKIDVFAAVAAVDAKGRFFRREYTLASK